MHVDVPQECVRRMLVRDPAARATAAEVLSHAWVKEDGVAGDNQIEPEVRGNSCACHLSCTA